MQPDVDIVNIVQIRELATAMGVDLSWFLPVGHPSIDGSKKISIEDMATIISEQIGSVTVPDDIHYAPPEGEDTVNDSSLLGADYSLEKWGVGFLKKGEDWQNDVVGGGWRLLGGTFVAGEVYVVHFKPKVSNILAAPGAIARLVSGIVELPSSTTIGESNYRKLIVLKGAETVTLPLASDYPENVGLFIVSDDGPRKQSTIQTQGTDTIRANSGTLTRLYLGQREFVTFVTDGTYWYVQNASPAIFGHPKMETGWLWDNTALNTLPATGGLYNRADYPRLWAFISKLAAAVPSAVLNEGAWATNKTRWGSGNGTTTFRVPDMRGYFPRYLDLGADVDSDRFDNGTGSIPGSAQADEFRAHTHTWTTPFSNDSLGGSGYVASSNGLGAPPPPVYVSLNSIISTEGGTETRPLNAGFYPLIII